MPESVNKYCEKKRTPAVYIIDRRRKSEFPVIPVLFFFDILDGGRLLKRSRPGSILNDMGSDKDYQVFFIDIFF